ncbi:MAG: lipid-A-disaccharide synthase-related protein [Cyanobium sp.]
MTPVLLLSNGHGEDLSGALLGRELLQRGVAVEALPLVGHGHAYRQAGIPVLGRTKEFSTGGLGYTSLSGRLTELREGQYLDLLQRLALLRGRRDRLIVAVGDLLPVLVAWLSRRPSVVYLVAYASHYEGRLRLPWPCGWLLRRRRILRIWSRDPLTASDLSRQLGKDVSFLGNPFLDLVSERQEARRAAGPPGANRSASDRAGGDPATTEGLEDDRSLPPQDDGMMERQILAVLPGSRLPEALRNLESLLSLLSLLPAPLRRSARLTLQAALVSSLDARTVARVAAPLGWTLEGGLGEADDHASQVLVRGEQRLQLHWGRFPTVLRGSDLVLSMTGTAAEQAVGLGKPVLQVEGPGPQFTAGFAEAQRRLLGPGLHCASGGAESLQAGAELAATLLERLRDPLRGPSWRAELAAVGEQRIGTPGGSTRMAEAIMDLLASRADDPR